jgi:hypothetical protein
MINSYALISALQNFMHERGVVVEHLTADPMVHLMMDWYRLVPLELLKGVSSTEALVYRYGGWSEGCATGFRFSLLRRVTEASAEGEHTEWFAGITLLFDPSGYADVPPLDIASSDWTSLEAFMATIEDSAIYRKLASATPMSVLLESGGLR